RGTGTRRGGPRGDLGRGERGGVRGGEGRTRRGGGGVRQGGHAAGWPPRMRVVERGAGGDPARQPRECVGVVRGVRPARAAGRARTHEHRAATGTGPAGRDVDLTEGQTPVPTWVLHAAGGAGDGDRGSEGRP